MSEWKATVRSGTHCSSTISPSARTGLRSAYRCRVEVAWGVVARDLLTDQVINWGVFIVTAFGLVSGKPQVRDAVPSTKWRVKATEIQRIAVRSKSTDVSEAHFSIFVPAWNRYQALLPATCRGHWPPKRLLALDRAVHTTQLRDSQFYPTLSIQSAQRWR
jgi:hypothetical protein